MYPQNQLEAMSIVYMEMPIRVILPASQITPPKKEKDENDKLSPRCLVRPSKILGSQFFEEDESYLKCMICFKVLQNPLECSECQKAFCGDCISKWKKTSSICPINRCLHAKYTDLHRYVKN